MGGESGKKLHLIPVFSSKLSKNSVSDALELFQVSVDTQRKHHNQILG